MICANCMVSQSLRGFVFGRGSLAQCDHCGAECSSVGEETLASHIEALFETTLVPFEDLPEKIKIDLVECGADY